MDGTGSRGEAAEKEPSGGGRGGARRSAAVAREAGEYVCKY